jgi:hypothetical protein
VIETVTQFSFDSKWGLRLLSAFFGAIGLWLVLAFKDNDRGEQTAGLIGVSYCYSSHLLFGSGQITLRSGSKTRNPSLTLPNILQTHLFISLNAALSLHPVNFAC